MVCDGRACNPSAASMLACNQMRSGEGAQVAAQPWDVRD